MKKLTLFLMLIVCCGSWMFAQYPKEFPNDNAGFGFLNYPRALAIQRGDNCLATGKVGLDLGRDRKRKNRLAPQGNKHDIRK